jgi:hypothetical protein
MSVGGRPKHSVWNMGFNHIKDPVIGKQITEMNNY